MNIVSYKKPLIIEVEMYHDMADQCHDIIKSGRCGYVYISYGGKKCKFFPDESIFWINEKCQVIKSGFRGKVIVDRGDDTYEIRS